MNQKNILAKIQDLESFGQSVLYHFIGTVIIIIIAFLAIKVLDSIINKVVRNQTGIVSADDRRIATVRSVLRSLAKYIILFIAAMVILSQFINVTSIIAVAGIGGAALSLGAKDLISDVVSGVFILVENNFAVKEIVSINGMTGSVEKITLRTTHLKDSNGDLHIINNGTITALTNHSREAYEFSFIVLIPCESEKTNAEIVKAVNEINMELKNNVDNLVEGPNIETIEEKDAKDVRVKITARTARINSFVLEQMLKDMVIERLKDRNIKVHEEDVELKDKKTAEIVFVEKPLKTKKNNRKKKILKKGKKNGR